MFSFTKPEDHTDVVKTHNVLEPLPRVEPCTTSLLADNMAVKASPSHVQLPQSIFVWLPFHLIYVTYLFVSVALICLVLYLKKAIY